MQTRLLASISGGLLGVVLTSTLNSELALNPTFAVILCSSAGVAVGYLASVLYDVFAGTGNGGIGSDK